MSEEPKEGAQRKRSKRHRMNRNNISDKARVDSVREFGVITRAAWVNYKANLKPKVNQYL